MTKHILNEVLANINNTQNLIQQLYEYEQKIINSLEQTNDSKKSLLLNNILLTLNDYSNQLSTLKNKFDLNSSLSLSEEDLYRVNEIKSYSNMILQNYSKPL